MFDYYDSYDCEIQCEEYYWEEDEVEYTYEPSWYEKYCYPVIEQF